jgi:two-component system, OmpR family, phosphate regulon sensor histidine kinase PhoR
MKQFNLSAADIGKPIEEVKDNLRFPTIIENIQQVTETNEILEKEIQTTDFKWYQMNVLPYFQREEHKTNGVIITFVDITARIRELNSLERLISDYETLLDTISHDVKAPLTTLVLAIDLFKNVSPEDEKEFQTLLQTLDNSIRKMHDIINELTDRRKQEHKYKSDEELLDFGHILEDVRLTLSHNIKESVQL